MRNQIVGQLSLFDIKQEEKDIQKLKPPIGDDGWILPGFRETREYLRKKGLSASWVDEVVDRNELGAVFIQDGKPWYKSNCPEYVGFWLCGHIGAVQCKAVPFLIPGLHQSHTCEKNQEQCPFRNR